LFTGAGVCEVIAELTPPFGPGDADGLVAEADPFTLGRPEEIARGAPVVMGLVAVGVALWPWTGTCVMTSVCVAVLPPCAMAHTASVLWVNVHVTPIVNRALASAYVRKASLGPSTSVAVP
jgi:hypothetical protein